VPSASSAPPSSPIPSLTQPPSPPDRLENQNDLASWRTLFANRVTWAANILAQANTLVVSIDDTNRSIAVIDRSLEAAATNLDQHVRSAAKNYDDLKNWAFDVLRSQEKLLTGWEPALEKLSRIPIHKAIAAVVAEAQIREGNQPGKRTDTLLDIISLQDARRSGKELAVVAGDFSNQVSQLGVILENIRQQSGRLSNEIQTGWKR
jgi:autophagy-related protein 11